VSFQRDKTSIATHRCPSSNPTTPQLFRVGDLVELDISFMSVPLAGPGEKVKMMTVLRAITLLDKQFRVSSNTIVLI